MKKLLLGLLLLLTTGCLATTSQIADIDKRLDKIEKKSVLAIAEQAAGTKMYGGITQEGGSGVGAMDRFASTSLATGDLCVVINSSGVVYFYRYDSTSSLTEATPWVITPYNSPATGRWILANSIMLKNDDSNASSLKLYEDYTTGTNYYDLQSPTSIAANQTFVLGRSRISSLTITSSSTTVTTDDTDKLYYVSISGLTGNYGLTLPATTGSGVRISVYVTNDSGDTDRFIIEPNGNDRIVGAGIAGTNADGDYIYPTGGTGGDTTGSFITLVDSASGRWTVQALSLDLDGSGLDWTYE